MSVQGRVLCRPALSSVRRAGFTRRHGTPRSAPKPHSRCAPASQATLRGSGRGRKHGLAPGLATQLPILHTHEVRSRGHAFCLGNRHSWSLQVLHLRDVRGGGPLACGGRCALTIGGGSPALAGPSRLPCLPHAHPRGRKTASRFPHGSLPARSHCASRRAASHSFVTGQRL